MNKSEIVAGLKRAIPGLADYGEVDQLRVEHYDNLVLERLIDVILERDYNQFVQALASNVQLGLEQW